MWTVLSGYIISIVFNYLLTKLHQNNFSNKDMSLIEISLGWLFQEHIRHDFNVTAGKRFMLKKDFRNRFITQSIKIIRNTVFWIHLVSILELGTLLFIFLSLFYLIFNQNIIINRINLNALFNPPKIEIIKFLKMFYEAIQANIKELRFFLFFLLFFRYAFLTTYGVFDFFFIIRPFYFLFFIFSILLGILKLIYAIYIYFLKITSVRIGSCFSLILNKLYSYLTVLLLVLNLLVFEINIENLVTENFFKELVFKIFFFTI